MNGAAPMATIATSDEHLIFEKQMQQIESFWAREHENIIERGNKNEVASFISLLIIPQHLCLCSPF